jgi:leader peptidase (prepilin peptidase)/N-methyltransferase
MPENRPPFKRGRMPKFVLDIFPWFSLVLGLILGSFYNVCIHRYLTGQKVGDPKRSHCPNCGHMLSWWENLPILSYVLLRGRCRSCAARISPRYPAVEAVSGLLALALGFKYGPSAEWIVYMAFTGALITASFIDFAEYILPDRVTLGGAPVAFVCAWLFLDVTWLDSLIGAALGAGLFFLLQRVYRRIRSDEGMGTGDIKLMLMLGALTGWQSLAFIIFTGSLSALAASLAYLRAGEGMRTAVPFGPFLALGAVLYILVGEAVMNWYLGAM